MGNSPVPAPSTHALSTLRQSVFIISLPFFVLNLILPIVGKERGAQVVEIGLFFTAFSIMTVIMRPLVGWALDHFGRRYFFLAGAVGYALTMLAFAWISEVWGIIAARILQGISSSLLWLSANAIIADLTGMENRAHAFGRLAESSSRGSLIGIWIGLTLLGFDPEIQVGSLNIDAWEMLFTGYGLATLVTVLLVTRRLPETHTKVDVPADSRRITWSRNWILLLLVTLVTGASWAMVSPILIIFLQEYLNADILAISWAFFPSALVWAFLPSRLGKLADRFGRKPMMVMGIVMAAVSSFFIPLLTSLFGFIILWAFQAICYAAGDPAEQALVADLTSGHQRGRAYGYYALAGDLGAAIGPLGGAWLYQSVSPSAPFIANAAILAVCAVILAVLLREPEKIVNPPNLPGYSS